MSEPQIPLMAQIPQIEIKKCSASASLIDSFGELFLIWICFTGRDFGFIFSTFPALSKKTGQWEKPPPPRF
jgi:hypothetical protein